MKNKYFVNNTYCTEWGGTDVTKMWSIVVIIVFVQPIFSFAVCRIRKSANTQNLHRPYRIQYADVYCSYSMKPTYFNMDSRCFGRSYSFPLSSTARIKFSF